MTRLKAVLFDIDMTLLDTGGAGRLAMGLAMQRCHGVDGATDGVAFGGRTDPSLVKEMLDRHVRPSEAAHIDTVLAEYLKQLPGQLAVTTTKVLPGVLSLISKLTHAGVRMGLCTGNVQRGAFIKLAQAQGLHGVFAFGGFGDDHATRPGLTAVGFARAKEACGGTLAPQEVAVIGDTPFDVVAGRHVGAFTVGVATGRSSVDELRAAGADLVLPNLSDATLLLARL